MVRGIRLFVVLVYDFGEKRVGKALKHCRKYLNWVQNSVFEGEISEVNLKKLKDELKRIMVPDEDSVIIYTWRTERYTKREIIGLEKGNLDTII
jgi:CRISPR-associated protein Cas2